MSKIHLAKGQMLCREGDQGNEMYIITQGRLQVFIRRGERNVVLATLVKGNSIGEMSLLEGEPRSASVVALEPSQLLVINKDNFKDHIQENPEMAIQIMNELSQRIRLGNEITAEKARIESELQVATRIQRSMLPHLFPPFSLMGNLALHATMETAREVGGDFYDFFLIDNHRLLFTIGDVSGKGVGAALFMVITRTILKNLALQGLSLSTILCQTNKMLCSENTEDMFVSAFVGILDTRAEEIEYSSAGHNPPLFAKRGEPFSYLKVPNNLVLGALSECSYTSSRIPFQPGDILFLYTDGVTEAMNEKDELFTEDRLLEVIRGLKDQNIPSIVNGVKEEIHCFAQGRQAADDMTILALSITKKKS